MLSKKALLKLLMIKDSVRAKAFFEKVASMDAAEADDVKK